MPKVVNLGSCRPVIRTRRIPQTDRHGARVSATTISAVKGRVTISRAWDYGIDGPHDAANNHARVAMLLAEKMGWCEDWARGEISAGDSGYTFVAITK